MLEYEAEIEYLSGFFCRYSITVFENKEAKASEGGTTENERKYFISAATIRITHEQTRPNGRYR
jgi:hypothetical protein